MMGNVTELFGGGKNGEKNKVLWKWSFWCKLADTFSMFPQLIISDGRWGLRMAFCWLVLTALAIVSNGQSSTVFSDDFDGARDNSFDSSKWTAEIGGGGILDIGCYPVVASRFLFGSEPKRVVALVVGVGFIGFFAWHAAVMTWQSLKFSDISQGVIAVPLWIPQLGYSGGLVILFVAFVDELIHVLRGFAPRYELPKPKSAEEIVERAMQSGV